MPYYLFQNEKTKEVREIFFHMNDDKVYSGKNGKEKWVRVWTIPSTNVDSKINPHDENAFIEKTGKMKGTLGDIMDYSKEMSERRGGIESDKITQKFYDDWSKKRHGKKHPNVKKHEIKKKLKEKGFSID
jgi:hypothetical protein